MPTDTKMSPVDSKIAAEAVGVVKIYGTGDTSVRALDGVTVRFGKAQFTAIMGPSGSGKSTLLHCLAGLDDIQEGAIRIGDVELAQLSDRQLTLLRRQRIGFIFQAFNLLPTLTAQENITLPMDIAGEKVKKDWLNQITDVLQIKDRLKHRPVELSGGQQQRVAAARALTSRPDIIFADEPSGNLDSKSGAQLLELLRQAVDSFSQTIVMVTHSPEDASYADRVIFLADGRVVDEISAADSTDRETRRTEILEKLKILGS